MIVAHLLSHVWLCYPMNWSMPGFPLLHYLLDLLKLMSIESVMPSNRLILYCLLLLLPSIFPSIRMFPNESALCMRWPEYWSFSFSIIPSKEIPGLISFRMDWMDSQESSPIPQFKSINSLALSLLHSPTLTPIHDHWKTIAFTRRTFVGKAMSLLFSVLSRLIITFLPRSKHLVDT